MNQFCPHNFQPQPEDILLDAGLLELFRVIKDIIRQDPNTERMAKLYFCIVYALSDLYPFYRQMGSDHIIFLDSNNEGCSVQLAISNSLVENIPVIDRSAVRPYTQIQLPKTPNDTMVPKQRGFYYQDERLLQEPMLLQRYAEQGILTQASLLTIKRKRKLSTSGTITKKQKIPHRNGEFNARRNDIISRMRSVMLADLEQKALQLPKDYSLAIEKVALPINIPESAEQAKDWLQPALAILKQHSNMKPHQDDGMNQNGIYYNNDYFRLYLAFAQFQQVFSMLFPQEITCTAGEDGRNANMKLYRPWIEPHLTETHWAAFRRNVLVGERMMQITQVVGQGLLLITKELSGSKLHLTFTNNEWEEFIQGLGDGSWDDSIDWSHEEDTYTDSSGSLLVNELRYKFATHLWFNEQGNLVPSLERKAARQKEKRKK